MKTQVEQNDACEAVLTVEVDPPAIEAAMHKAAQRMSEKRNLPGFRKGKAPYSVVVNAYGEDAILDEALDTLGPETYRMALEEQAIEPSAVGTMKRIVSRSPLTLEFLVPVKPQVEIADYRSIRLPFEEPVIPEEDVEKTLEQLRESWNPSIARRRKGTFCWPKCGPSSWWKINHPSRWCSTARKTRRN
jgi:trigger factor